MVAAAALEVVAASAADDEVAAAADEDAASAVVVVWPRSPRTGSARFTTKDLFLTMRLTSAWARRAGTAAKPLASAVETRIRAKSV